MDIQQTWIYNRPVHAYAEMEVQTADRGLLDVAMLEIRRLQAQTRDGGWRQHCIPEVVCCNPDDQWRCGCLFNVFSLMVSDSGGFRTRCKTWCLWWLTLYIKLDRVALCLKNIQQTWNTSFDYVFWLELDVQVLTPSASPTALPSPTASMDTPALPTEPTHPSMRPTPPARQPATAQDGRPRHRGRNGPWQLPHVRPRLLPCSSPTHLWSLTRQRGPTSLVLCPARRRCSSRCSGGRWRG
jgi:hypothetical protein